MSRRTPHRLSIILGVYFIIQSILFGATLLFWTYYTNISSINIELEKAFGQRQDIVEELLEHEADRIDTALYEMKINKDLLAELSKTSDDRKLDVFLNYGDKIARHKLDVLFISTTDNPVWLDASSPFPHVVPILDQVAAAGRTYLSEARLDHFDISGTCLTGIFKSRKIVLESGEVLGIVIGGTILNDNFSLLHDISLKSKTPTVILTEDDKIIASSSTFNSVQQSEIYIHTLTPCEHSDDGFHRMSNYELIFVDYNIEFPGNNSNASILLGLPDDVLRKLQQSYLYTVYLISVIIVFFLFSTFFVTRRLIYPSVRRVLEYTERISRDEKDVRLSSGSIIEMNRIGSAMEKMVDSIHLSQKELQMSERKFRSYVENAPTGIFVTDIKGNYIEVNEAAKQITGYSSDELLNMKINDLIPEEDQKIAFDHFQRAVTTGKVSGDLQFIRKDKHIGFWTVDAIKLSENKILGFVSDISNRKNAEDKIKSSLQEKEVLLQEVHHRVKNNLQFIISLLAIEMQHHGEGSEIYNDTISRIRRFSIIYSKLYIQEDMANINFAVTIKESVEEILSMHSEINDKISFKYDIPQPIFPIDKAIPLSLIINELVTNSIKYAFDGEGLIDLVLHGSPEGDIMKFVYSDNGRGMQSAQPGFGTKLVNILADQLSLDIDISSEYGVIYEFNPREKRHVTTPQNAEILYVEDEFIIALARIKTLEEMGYRINNDVISSGEEALEYLKDAVNLPSLILMDIGLAGKLNGIETVREIRKEHDIPILFSTGYEDKAKRDEIALISNTGYIGKTCSQKELKTAVDSLLKKIGGV